VDDKKVEINEKIRIENKPNEESKFVDDKKVEINEKIRIENKPNEESKFREKIE